MTTRTPPTDHDTLVARTVAEWPVSGDDIRAARTARGWTRQRLASEIGCSEPSCGNWELSRTTPTIPHRYRIIEVLGLAALGVGVDDPDNEQEETR